MMSRIKARELEQKAEFNNPIKEVIWRELTRVDPKKKEAVLKVLSHFGGDSKAVDMILILYGDGISYPGVFLNKPIEFFEEIDKELLKRNPHRRNMLNPEFVKFEKHRVDFFVNKLRSEMGWGANYIFSDEVVFEGFTRVFDSKYFNCEYKINYDEKLGYSIKELMKHYEDLSEVMSVDWEKRIGRYGKVKIRGIIAIVQLKVYLNGKFLFEMENDKGEIEMVSVEEFKLLSKSKTHGLGL